jgi:hypothetical protein
VLFVDATPWSYWSMLFDWCIIFCLGNPFTSFILKKEKKKKKKIGVLFVNATPEAIILRHV